MAQPRGFGSFDPTLTTKFGPTGTEGIDSLNRGIQLGIQQGQQVARAVQQSRRAKLDAENARRLEETRQAQMYKMHVQQREGLYFEDETKVDGIQNARAAASTMLVNKANELYQAQADGRISPLQYRKGMTILDGEVGKIKVAEETIRVNAEKYLAGVDAGTLSNTNSSKVESWWAAVADGTAELEYKQDKNGQIIIEGSWDDPTDDIKGKVRVPLGDIEKMSTVRYQPKETVNDYMNAEAKSAVEAKVQNTIAQKGNINDLKGVDFKNPNDPTRKELTTIFENNFQDYMDTLGEGDAVSQVGQYIMDTGKGNYLVSEALLNNFDDVGSKNMDTMQDLEYLMSKGKLDAFKEELKKDYVERSLATYNSELATAQGKSQTEALKQAGIRATGRSKILAYNEKVKEINSPKKDGPQYNIEKDLGDLISSLTGGEGEVENLVRALVKSPETGEVVDQLSKFNLKASTVQKDNPEKGGDPIKGIKISGPGMKPIDFYGTDFTDVQNLTKELLYKQTGISRKEMDAIWNRLTNKYSLK